MMKLNKQTGFVSISTRIWHLLKNCTKGKFFFFHRVLIKYSEHLKMQSELNYARAYSKQLNMGQIIKSKETKK